MNPNVSITSIQEFDDITNNLNDSLNRIRLLFDEEGKSISMLFENPNSWSGKAKESAKEKYTDLSSMYPSITESLENFVRFLVTTSVKYKQFETSVNNDIETNISNLDVNS